MAMFLFALAGIPPLVGWFAKFEVFYALVYTRCDGVVGYILAVVVGVNSVIAGSTTTPTSPARCSWTSRLPTATAPRSRCRSR